MEVLSSDGGASVQTGERQGYQSRRGPPRAGDLRGCEEKSLHERDRKLMGSVDEVTKFFVDDFAVSQCLCCVFGDCYKQSKFDPSSERS